MKKLSQLLAAVLPIVCVLLTTKNLQAAPVVRLLTSYYEESVTAHNPMYPEQFQERRGLTVIIGRATATVITRSSPGWDYYESEITHFVHYQEIPEVTIYTDKYVRISETKFIQHSRTTQQWRSLNGTNSVTNTTFTAINTTNQTEFLAPDLVGMNQTVAYDYQNPQKFVFGTVETTTKTARSSWLVSNAESNSVAFLSQLWFIDPGWSWTFAIDLPLRSESEAIVNLDQSEADRLFPSERSFYRYSTFFLHWISPIGVWDPSYDIRPPCVEIIDLSPTKPVKLNLVQPPAIQ